MKNLHAVSVLFVCMAVTACEDLSGGANSALIGTWTLESKTSIASDGSKTTLTSAQMPPYEIALLGSTFASQFGINASCTITEKGTLVTTIDQVTMTLTAVTCGSGCDATTCKNYVAGNATGSQLMFDYTIQTTNKPFQLTLSQDAQNDPSPFASAAADGQVLVFTKQ